MGFNNGYIHMEFALPLIVAARSIFYLSVQSAEAARLQVSRLDGTVLMSFAVPAGGNFVWRSPLDGDLMGDIKITSSIPDTKIALAWI